MTVAASLVDPEAISTIYQGILAQDFQWLLLTYAEDDNAYNQFTICAYGSKGLGEFKENIVNGDKVYVGLYRQNVNGQPGYVLINYTPREVSGVVRARTLVHCRRLGTLFTVRQTTLTIDSLSNLTEHSVLEALKSPDTPLTIQITPITSDSIAMSPNGPDSPYTSRSSTESSKASSSPIAKTAATFSKFLRKKGFRGVAGDSSPPPPPPKDVYSVKQFHGRFLSAQALSPTQCYNGQPGGPRGHRVNSFSEFATLYQEPYSDDSDIEEPHFPVQSHKAPSAYPRSFAPQLSLPSKWARNPSKSVSLDQAEREQQRLEEQRRKAAERERERRDQEERDLRLQRKREEALRAEQEEEERRRVSIEEDLRRAAALRRQKEELERIEEEKRRLALEEKRRLERERRLEEHRRLEEWRHMQAQLVEDTTRREQEAKAREEEEKKARIKQVEKKVKEGVQGDSVVSGWVTIQMNESLVWKRRYYRFSQGHVYFFRSPKDTQLVLDKVLLRSRLSGLREWDQGYDELEAIPHSFAVEFDDDRSPWLMFADTEDEKFKLMGLFHCAAGLDV